MTDDEHKAILEQLDALSESLSLPDGETAVRLAEETGRTAICFGGRFFVVDAATRERISVNSADGADLFVHHATGRLVTIPWT